MLLSLLNTDPFHVVRSMTRGGVQVERLAPSCPPPVSAFRSNLADAFAETNTARTAVGCLPGDT